MTHPNSNRVDEPSSLSLVPHSTPSCLAGSAPAASAPRYEILRALCKQLRDAANSEPQPLSKPPDKPWGATTRASLLACADAMDRFAFATLSDHAQRQRLESQVHGMQAELHQARQELAGTRAQERDARHLALHDSLTALPNRRYFTQRLAQALTDAAPRRQSLAVLYLDLDDFKPINDAHGHAMGDEMLRIIANRLSHTLRSADMVSRLGGDEFACILDGLADRAQISHMACKVIDAVAAPCKIGTLQLQVRPSVGISLFPDDASDVSALLRNADAAMFNAKRHQSGYAFFDEALPGWTRQAH